MSDVQGLALVNHLSVEKEWTQDRIAAWVNDPDVGFRAYLDRELLGEMGIRSQVSVREWKVIGTSAEYGKPPNLSKMNADCLSAHQMNTHDFDLIAIFFNVELGASFGGGGQLLLSKWVSPSVIHHETQHAISVSRLGLNANLHSNLADVSLNPISLDFGNAFSLMYGNGQYSRQDRLDVHPEFGLLPTPLTTANRWIANVLPPEAVCEAPDGQSVIALRTWGEQGSACLLLTVTQSDGRTLTVELQPTLSSFQQRKLDFLQGLQPGSRFLVGVKYPQAVDPNATDWAAVVAPSGQAEPGWIKDEILFSPGQTARIGNATFTFASKAVQVDVTRSP